MINQTLHRSNHQYSKFLSIHFVRHFDFAFQSIEMYEIRKTTKQANQFNHLNRSYLMFLSTTIVQHFDFICESIAN